MNPKTRRLLELTALFVGLTAGILSIRKHLKDANKPTE